MAIEYTYYGAADLDTDGLRSTIAATLGVSISPDGSMTRDVLRTTRWRGHPPCSASSIG